MYFTTVSLPIFLPELQGELSWNLGNLPLWEPCRLLEVKLKSSVQDTPKTGVPENFSLSCQPNSIYRNSLKFPFFFFFVCHTAWHVGSQFPDQGLNPRPLKWKHGVLTTGPPGMSLKLPFNSSYQFMASTPGKHILATTLDAPVSPDFKETVCPSISVL